MHKFLLVVAIVAFAVMGLGGERYALGGNEGIQPGGSGEQITLTTYYPSPYGVYKTLRLYPNPDQPNVGVSCSNPGEMSYQDSTDAILYCKGNTPNATWQPLGGGGSSWNQPIEGQACANVGQAAWNDVSGILVGRRLLYCNANKIWVVADSKGLGTIAAEMIDYGRMQTEYHRSCTGVPWVSRPPDLAVLGGCISGCNHYCSDIGWSGGTLHDAIDQGVFCTCY